MPSDLRNSGAPATLTSNRGNHLATASVPHDDAPGPSTPQEREVRAQRARRRLREADERRRAGQALNDHIAAMGDREPFDSFTPSESWTRDLANDLVAQGFTVEYVAHRLALPEPAARQAVTA